MTLAPTLMIEASHACPYEGTHVITFNYFMSGVNVSVLCLVFVLHRIEVTYGARNVKTGFSRFKEKARSISFIFFNQTPISKNRSEVIGKYATVQRNHVPFLRSFYKFICIIN